MKGGLLDLRLQNSWGRVVGDYRELRGHTEAMGWPEAHLSKRDSILCQTLTWLHGDVAEDLRGPAARAWLGLKL